MSAPIVLFDACILYPASLRDVMMYLAGAGLFQAKWTDRIHDEWISNLLEHQPEIHPEKLERTRRKMNEAVLEPLVIEFEPLIDTLHLPDPNDRHVLAAAIHVGASFIITNNIRDFPGDILAHWGIEAITPDKFIVQLINENAGAVLAVVKRHRVRLKNPPKTAEEHLATLEKQGLRRTVAFLRKHVMDI
jgi:predicted nucleic acid-binding protein